ncbi:hypothetical protein [Sphingopyxis alaskensis]|uniref:hypothetical protein n=1 Tax=Sphingopyxis alaskensis TaxID=117207 RepID=UPI00203B23CD|nr:hypothetical protein [Sphingopyxis alaskensis]MCM3419029.1 hypothetical protein [Sphingopyxis alaskensis]
MSAAISTTARLAKADELLIRTSQFLRANVASLIETSSELDRAKLEPIPGTITPRATPYIARIVAHLRDIDRHLGAPLELGPVWLDDLLARRNGWEDAL